MNLANCIECGAVMVDNPTKLCPNCIREEELAEDKVSEYLRENNRKASLDEIAKETGVKVKVIFRMLKRGRLESSGVEISYPCETCGAPIFEGRLCDNCSQSIAKQIKHDDWQAPEKREAAKKDEKMYTKDLFRRK